jgi:hypothetical protein
MALEDPSIPEGHLIACQRGTLMKIEARWLLCGYFDLSHQDSNHTTTQEIRAELSARLRVPRMQIAMFPIGPNMKHTFWWRDGAVDYAEAQYFARIAESYPVLSLGVSVEKGLDDVDHLPAARRDPYLMNRSVWDWPRAVLNANALLAKAIPASAKSLSRPIVLRIDAKRVGPTEEIRDSRTYVLAEGAWFRRYVGTAGPKEIAEYLASLDRQRDWWVNLYIGADFGPSEADGMEPRKAAEILLSFKTVRDLLRGK